MNKPGLQNQSNENADDCIDSQELHQSETMNFPLFDLRMNRKTQKASKNRLVDRARKLGNSSVAPLPKEETLRSILRC